MSGIYAAGKTSLIQSISQTSVVATEVRTSGQEAEVKSHTTVAMDFGTYRLDSEPPIRLMLYGTPGQARFRFMIDVLKRDVDVITFVVNGQADDHTESKELFAATWKNATAPVVIAVNRCDDLDDARRVATELGADESVPVIPCQLVDAESGLRVIISVLRELLGALDDADDRSTDRELGGKAPGGAG